MWCVFTLAARGKCVTNMESDRFRLLLDTPGPFASVYFADSEDIDDVGARVGLNWRALRERLDQQGADESVTAEVERAICGLSRRRRLAVGHSSGQ